MFENIEKYIEKSLNDRQFHINLKEKCLEIGGNNSTEYRGLLAHYLKTTIPTKTKFKISVCHLCGNHKCSNPKHLYWGTDKENLADQKLHGTYKSIYESTINKYGKEKAKEIWRKAASKGGKANKGKKKLTKEKINFYKAKIIESNPEKYGWVTRASKLMGLSHTQVSRIYKEYF